ncbi:MAG: hypothetical protein K9G67_09765 [Bacteroidales bacterium]|nr:hypothetical protein [Bacteroidales bacterium]MCF8346222.1 hypothetical protein [Bacteroidales bacterium]MCF8376629.1 hypothetical protein [Bacteroidales bacterium]MCF8400649.1 hypothetical protein [Bacteroidales bacterium]
MKWMIILTFLLIANVPADNCKNNKNVKPGLDNFASQPGTLENRVKERIIKELPTVAGIYPGQTTGSLEQGIYFLIGQEATRDKITYEKVVANKAYTQDNPRKEYLKEEVVGTADFYIFANGLKVSVDFDHSGPIWRQSPIEKADSYNKAEAERRNKGSMGSTQAFQSKRPLPGLQRDEYMTIMEYYHYALVFDYELSGVAGGQMFVARNKCLVPGYPIESYNGFVLRIFEGDIPTEIDMRVLLKQGENEVLLQLHSKAMRNQGLPDRILHVQQAENILTRMIRIVLEEMGGTVTTDQALQKKHDTYKKGQPIPQLGAVIQGLRLYAGNKNGVPPAQRKYSNTFLITQPGSIWWELELEHPGGAEASNPLIEAILFGPNREAIDRTATHLNIEAGLENSKHVHRLNKTESGTREPGRYILDFYISGDRVAGTSFKMK